MVKPELKELVQRAWDHYYQFKDRKYVVPMMPILYFGDLEAYENSDVRIITAALNPSDKEFTDDKNNKDYTFFRFSSAKKIQEGHHSLVEKEIEAYIQSLNEYFTDVNKQGDLTYYKKWFDKNEDLFNAINASYYPSHSKYAHMEEKYSNTVLHTDVCTPIATDPTWSGEGLKGDEEGKFNDLKKELIKSGLVLWKELISYLEPDIILLSAGQKHVRKRGRTDRFGTLSFVDSERFKGSGSPVEFERYKTRVTGETRRWDSILEHHTITINSKRCHVFYDTGENGYFASLGTEKETGINRKRALGEKINKFITGKLED